MEAIWRLRELRQRPLIAWALAALLVGASFAFRASFPYLPPFIGFFPVLTLIALFAGPSAAVVALIALSGVGWWFLDQTETWQLTAASAVGLVGFAFGAGLIIAVVSLLDRTISHNIETLDRLGNERERLSLALTAAHAGTWERTPDNDVIWDRTFYDLLGLDPDRDRPTTDRFISLIHPEDRERARLDLVASAAGKPIARATYRLVKPDGSVIFTETFRGTRTASSGRVHVLGVTQDITQRKLDEERLVTLFREVSHRVKNQFTVILAMVNAVARHATNVREFQADVAGRIYGLSRSHDLLVNNDWKGSSLRALLAAQLLPFAEPEQWDASGPDVTLTPSAIQNLGMAFFELATNAAKHGAFATPTGRVRVTWEVSRSDLQKPVLRLVWKETGGRPTQSDRPVGFGSAVLERIAPQGLGGKASLDFASDGLQWVLEASEAVAVTAGGAK